ncbi:hypothetical protein [Blastopirellula marina]|uniref:hypothetical protein n=1 Tax=Blastopirellula marina TaxID=124 RepID=UPI001F2FB915|nr:hypothetical protein [Blastopirellula marina]
MKTIAPFAQQFEKQIQFRWRMDGNRVCRSLEKHPCCPCRDITGKAFIWYLVE